MTCGRCTHWLLAGPLARFGYGQCLARPAHQREAFTTSAQNACRLGRFVALVAAPAPAAPATESLF